LTRQANAGLVPVGADVLRWRSADESARLQDEAAKRVATGSALGESAVADVLLARRNALEAALAAVGAQVDALENRARLLLGARQLWNFDVADK
ncbi:MAG TPA: hypothetical protein PK177_18535, partial [Burkholderiaceae bacterium]|nr:hypothetical protein [Burkholderiaceae bacterium]